MNATTKSLLALALLMLAPSIGGSVEFLSADYYTRPGELRAVFQLSGAAIQVSTDRPKPDKLVVEVRGVCGENTGDPARDCPDGPVASLQPLYRFAPNLPVRQMNVVDMGTGQVYLIWELRSSGLQARADRTGDRVEVLIGTPRAPDATGTSRGPGTRTERSVDAPPTARRRERAGPEANQDRASAASLSRPPMPRGTGSAGPDDSRAATPPTTRLEPPDPSFLDQDREYRLGVGDRIQLVVHADENLDRDALEVQPTGYVDFPLVGSLPVAGHTVVDVERELERLLGEKYLRDADSTILVDEYNSQFVNVMGAVEDGGKVPLKGRTTLMDALTEAGGTTNDASGNIIIHRKGETRPMTVRLYELLSGTEGSNLLLRHGDTVNVERKKPFYVSGEVKNPGKFEIEPGMTVLDAIAMAGGITEFGKEKKAILIRTVAGDREEIILNPKAIQKGKEENLEVQPGDHIKVPGAYF